MKKQGKWFSLLFFVILPFMLVGCIPGVDWYPRADGTWEFTIIQEGVVPAPFANPATGFITITQKGMTFSNVQLTFSSEPGIKASEATGGVSTLSKLSIDAAVYANVAWQLSLYGTIAGLENEHIIDGTVVLTGDGNQYFGTWYARRLNP